MRRWRSASSSSLAAELAHFGTERGDLAADGGGSFGDGGAGRGRMGLRRNRWNCTCRRATHHPWPLSRKGRGKWRGGCAGGVFAAQFFHFLRLVERVR